jgi:hypothetical protein
VAALILLSAQTASAQTNEDRLEQFLAQGQDLYDTLEIERSRGVLVQAIQLAEAEAIDAPVVASIYIMLGTVDFALAATDEDVINSFVRGLRFDEAAELNPFYATPDLEVLLEQAREIVRTEGPPDPFEPDVLLLHNPVVTARAGEPVAISTGITPDSPVARVVLSFRRDGALTFETRDMRRDSPVSFSALIPAVATAQGVHVEYYLSGLDAVDGQIDASGSPANPHLIIILGGTDVGHSPSSTGTAVSIALGVGTGGGLATGEPIVMGDEVDLNPGMALTPLHFGFDVSFEVGGGLSMGPFMRLQTVLLADGVEFETILGAKIRWYFTDEVDERMYASFGAGYGSVRHTVDLKPTVEFVDTTREGPLHGGVGFGHTYFFSERVGLLNDIYAMVLFDQTSVQLDYTLSLIFRF